MVLAETSSSAVSFLCAQSDGAGSGGGDGGGATVCAETGADSPSDAASFEGSDDGSIFEAANMGGSIFHASSGAGSASGRVARAETSSISKPFVAGVKRKKGELSQGFSDWLSSLDGGKGVLLQYLDAIAAEFDDLSQVCAVWTGEGSCDDSSFMNSVDPVFWDAAGVRKLGHKLLFARGIEALHRLRHEQSAGQ
eukprot:gnl/TRDRNA2_/TRDRNA2_164852_c0_seq4.p1 gnl/TRDRNA2_/TRDRNA2_164852_c0~~gnl/TRDRNA2_/TRDRNA2_164852_c0_seq4.p1  ORF type:complete len:195 (+),score=35.91 gnl/TRDRNA2_/TRDRNA2_164852_c0_seq4:93-677(+)